MNNEVIMVFWEGWIEEWDHVVLGGGEIEGWDHGVFGGVDRD